MCGIAGLLGAGGRVIEPRYLRLMTEALRHRGPDDEGYVFMDLHAGVVAERGGPETVPARANGLVRLTDSVDTSYSLGLGHRRLSIIDVSAAGHQPMASEDRRLWLTYNGEIYNYIELRRQLEGIGHTFRSGSDTEVVLHAYQEWGVDCLSRFDGMWAFALADLRRRRLLCARDRLGVKPFYYHFDGRTFAFSSEIRALLRLPFVNPVSNDPVVWDFLVLGSIDHTNETFFADIFALDAGHFLEVSFDGTVERQKFWQLPTSAETIHGQLPARRDATERARQLIVESVRRRLRSDVSVGFCLSGGLDSSSVVGVADSLLDEANRPQVGSQLKVFHAAFDDPTIDERDYVRAVIARTRVVPHYVFPSGSDLVDDYERLLWYQEQPFGGPSIYAQHRVFGLARSSGVKVLLDGQGGDELFAGYNRYYGLHLARLLAAGELEQAATALRANGTRVARHAAFETAIRLLPRALARRALLTKTTDVKLIRPDFLATYMHRLNRVLDHARSATNVSEALRYDLTNASLPRLLRFEDRNSMAFSLESRVPFADDPRLIEFVATLPDSMKLWKGWSKYVLREAMGGLIPEPVRWRRRKLGFAVPERRWADQIRGGPLSDVLLQASSRYINRSWLESGLRPGAARPIPSRLFWRLLEVCLWERALDDKLFLGSPPAGHLGQDGAALAG